MGRGVLYFFAIGLVEGLFSFFCGFGSLILFADVFVHEFVAEELHGVVVVVEEFVVSVDLVGEASFLGRGLGTAPSLIRVTGVSQ